MKAARSEASCQKPENNMEKFAVIDTETNWDDQVMSIGTVIADAKAFSPIAARYHVLPSECSVGGMYTDALFPKLPVKPILCSREEAVSDLLCWLSRHGVKAIFAYNARFDRGHLPELHALRWHDIMRAAIYRQTNPKIPPCADCYSTGRMKHGYSVEAMLRLLSGKSSYRETHNALLDALDELTIMRLMERSPEDYLPL